MMKFFRLCKKMFKFFLIFILFFGLTNNVYARMLTMDEVLDKYNDFLDKYNQIFENITVSIDSNNKTLDIYGEEDGDSQKIFSFSYTDEYVEYDNRDVALTQENVMELIPAVMWMNGLMDSIIKGCGYEDKEINFDEIEAIDDNFYDIYGILMESEPFSFNNTNDEGVSYNSEGDFLRYFKISLDTDKIDALIEKYGSDAKEKDPNKIKIANIKPTLKIKDITDNSATIYPHVEYTSEDPDYTVFCYIYRSVDKDGTYEKINDMACNCTDAVGIVDNNLNSNTTYYYKTIAVDGLKYSDIIQVTTKNSFKSSTENKNEINTKSQTEDLIENPKTGAFLPIFVILISMLVGIIILNYTKKKIMLKK